MPEPQDVDAEPVWYIIETTFGYQVAQYIKLHDMDFGDATWVDHQGDERCAWARSVVPLPPHGSNDD